MDLVSIIVPIYNMELYLNRCMTSLLEQTYKNIEILLIDDGSTDSSPSLCDDYVKKHPELIRVYHKLNGGLSSARNEGIRYAKGKYIIFPDPDDWVETDYIEKAVKLEKEHVVDLVCLGFYIDYDDKCIPVNDENKTLIMDKKAAKRSLILPPNMEGFAWNKLYHLDIIKRNELYFNDDVGIAEDLDFAYRYLKYCNQVCFAPQDRVYHYYQRIGAATHGNFSRAKLDSIKAFEKIIQCEKDKILVGALEEEICNTTINLSWLYKKDRCNDKDAWYKMRMYLRKYLLKYLCSKRYNVGRKVQAVLALLMPGLYAKIKVFLQRK